jgi:hypothetical protein
MRQCVKDEWRVDALASNILITKVLLSFAEIHNAPMRQLINVPTRQLANAPTRQCANSPMRQLVNAPTCMLEVLTITNQGTAL